jgi:hypothetical protein
VGEAERLKFCWAAAFTVRLTVVVCDKLPDVPVIVTVTVLVAAVLFAVSVSVLVLVVPVGLKAAVTPLGRPDEEKATVPVKLFRGVTVIVLVPLVPWLIATFGRTASCPPSHW